ncbi:MAG: hypothetical protein Q9212_007143, partial [Teloschistes hypoglaucus]
ILLLRRVHHTTSFASAHVFPGGHIDREDGPLPPREDARVHEDGPAYRVGAIRECFEESGILLAKDPREADSLLLLRVDEGERDRGRKAVHDKEIGFKEWVGGLGGVPATDALHPFTRWLTPGNLPKRFSTQMYLYFLPLAHPGIPQTLHIPTSDGGVEHTEAQFLSAAAWLDLAKENKIILFPPQFFLLSVVGDFLKPVGTSGASETLQAQRDRLLEFAKTGDPTWGERCISPTPLKKEKGKGEVLIMALDEPGPELEGTDRKGDAERVIWVQFQGREGTSGLHVGWRRDAVGDELDDAENREYLDKKMTKRVGESVDESMQRALRGKRENLCNCQVDRNIDGGDGFGKITRVSIVNGEMFSPMTFFIYRAARYGRIADEEEQTCFNLSSSGFRRKAHTIIATPALRLPITKAKERDVKGSTEGKAREAVYKATKIDANGNVKSNGKATVEDLPEDDDMEAGPAPPPDEPDEIIDDEEGRFFGGGITSDTADVLDFIDKQDEGHDEQKPERIDAVWLRKLALNFERRISKNSELRAKFEDDPQKFMGSEADLDADIKALSILSEHPGLYGEFAKLGCVASLVSLLSHENTDIAIDAIEVINELTDEDVEAEQEQWDTVVDAMLEADLSSLLFDNITRLDETNESDRAGLYHILSILENLSSRSAISESVGKDTAFVPWLLKRIQHKETTVSQNKQYSAEILAILLQSSSLNRTKLIEADGLDILLQLLSPYRKRDPAKGTEEEEYVENLFDCVTCCVDEVGGKTKFLEAEGIELCLIMLREGKMSKPRALRLLDHALGGTAGAACCEKLVEAAGLKIIFSILMKKHDNQTTAHLLGILSSLLRSLPADSPPRIRLLAKFVEKDYEKIARTVHIRRDCANRVGA